jgi:hypothetical protein
MVSCPVTTSSSWLAHVDSLPQDGSSTCLPDSRRISATALLRTQSFGFCQQPFASKLSAAVQMERPASFVLYRRLTMSIQ